ncbi:uncharacterized protein YbjT (DUF2867 family) [Actinomadura coerulea]|uniref:Uncharacterized protein YbjT (DUF2867 family) n=1 Tax=Actinomadura coerulea TaxID=46159 RepID=A0A7X0FXM9_9ACTN|nr:hypothetical protein [Actinomadura coerulea]MBB6395429.1 uncharacterized protein YbjT (DUF2867 family) [Actinomadura coerulea]GGQ46711.1 hypothetical protein GCM10010187_76170 [Actinomadura coerulea]
MKIVIVGGTGLIGAKVVARPREVLADPPAHYFGAEMRERDLVPDDGAATLGEIEYADRPAGDAA